MENNYIDLESTNNMFELQTAHEQITNGINQVKENIKDEELINVIVAKENKNNWKVNPLNQFVILFIDNFEEILINYNLTKVDIIILLGILKLMQMGNHVQITQQQIAKKTNKTQAQVSRCWKKLIKYNILITTDAGSKFINPQLIVKGSLKKISDSDNFDELSSKSDYQNYTKNSFKKNYENN